MRVWLNGRQIADFDRKTGFVGQTLKLKLQKDWNDLLIKSVNGRNENWGAYALSLSFSQIDGIRFDDFANLPAAPEYARVPE